MLSEVMGICDDAGFELLGVEKDRIEKESEEILNRCNKDPATLFSTLKKKEKSFSENYLINKIFQNCSLPLQILLSEAKKPANYVEGKSAKEGAGFMGKFKDWMLIKKKGVEQGARPEEIAFALAGISASARKKGFLLMGVDSEKSENLALELLKGKRKAYSSVSEILQKVKNMGLSALEQRYVILLALEKLNLPPYPSIHEFSKIWPDLKARSFGRKGAKKKK